MVTRSLVVRKNPGSGPDIGYIPGDPVKWYEDGMIRDIDEEYKNDPEIRERMDYVTYNKDNIFAYKCVLKIQRMGIETHLSCCMYM